MNVILTSDIMSPDKRQLNSLNGFVDKIHEYVDDINCLYIPSDPQSPFLTHTISSHHKRAFKKSGFTVKRWEVLYPFKKENYNNSYHVQTSSYLREDTCQRKTNTSMTFISNNT